MAETIDEIHYDYEEEGTLVRKQLDKQVLSKGAWSTIMFLFQELDRKTETWKPPKVAIVRYQKSNGVFRQKSSFKITNAKQAGQVTEVLNTWFQDGGKGLDIPEDT